MKLKNVAKPTTYRASGITIWTAPDRQRLINRMHMKGYCTKEGFPISIPMLTIVEPQVIVERYNSVIRGQANYYMGFIKNKSSINRWIYILRYSCLKTLAHKYGTTIPNIFKRFGYLMNNKSTRTISIPVTIKVNGKTYHKRWTLLTYKEITKLAVNNKEYRKLEKKFWDIENREILGEYPLKDGKIAKVTNQDYLEKINWTNIRTQASFGMPCALCNMPPRNTPR